MVNIIFRTIFVGFTLKFHVLFLTIFQNTCPIINGLPIQVNVTSKPRINKSFFVKTIGHYNKCQNLIAEHHAKIFEKLLIDSFKYPKPTH